jgi:pentatricopeptide repeat-containing protein PET309
MLERTSTCLESGGRKLLRGTKPCLRSRRTLHSAFWHHGASDLSLPGWWAAPSARDGGSGTTEDRPAGTSATSRSSSGVLLDFLYPEKTLALLKQLSLPTTDTSSPRRRHLHGPPIRHYATTQLQPIQRETGTSTKRTQQASGKTAAVEDAQALRKLRQFLGHKEPGGQDEAWQLYSSIPPSQLADDGHWHLRADLLEYLALDDDPSVPSRILQLFEELPEQHRRTSSYRAAIAAYISLRMVGPALQLLERLPSHRDHDFSLVGIDIVLRRTILDEQWDLSLRLFKLFLDHKRNFGKVSADTSIRWGNTIPEIWKGVTTLRKLDDHLQSFVKYVREFHHKLKSDKEKKRVLSLFTMTFVPHVMDQVLQDHTHDEQATSRFFDRLIQDLEGLNLKMAVFYEQALERLLEVPADRAANEISGLRIRLYRQYRQLCLDSIEEENKQTLERPSLHLLRNLIVHYCDLDQLPQAYDILQDHRLFYPDEPMRAGLLKYLVHCFADHGDSARTQEYFEQFRLHYKNQVNLKLVSALPFACARRADVEGTITQFNRIRDEFGLVQDTACWNILLLAYVRADDLDGALECFNTMAGNAIAPDLFTFGTLLDLCAQRGDVEAFEALFSRAEQMGIALTQDVRARSGYVQVFLRAGDLKGAEAIAQGMLKSWRSGTLSGHTLTHTWNLLIQHHALERDIASARERYREMVDNNIPLDSWTYGSLMRALIEVKQTNAAYKILTKTMPQHKLRAHALHYAIVMTGFLREGGGQLDMALATYERMKEDGIPQTLSSLEATIRTLGASDLRKLRDRPSTHANYKLADVDEAVEEVLAGAVQGQALYREPQHSRQVDSRNFGAAPQALYGLLISLYAHRDAYKTCQKLFKRAERSAPDVENYTMPMNLIAGAMEAHLRAGEHAEMARLWELARTAANKLTRTFSQVATPELPRSASANLLNASVKGSYGQSHISANRRNILYKATRLYIRSLLDPLNPNQDALKEAQRTMRDLVVNGYTIDVFTWNELVSTLAQRGHLVDAFAICEEYLMPNFPGWRNLYPSYVRKDRAGYNWMELRHDEIKQDSIMPRYKTLIILASELRKARKDERNGVGYNEARGAWQRELLEGAAPMSIRAIQTMPRTNDRLQMEYFHNAL